MGQTGSDEWLQEHSWILKSLDDSDAVFESLEDKWSFYFDVHRALKTLPGGISPEAKISPLACLEGNVLVDAGAQILPYSMLIGPCYIGKGSIVGNFAVVRPGTFISRNVLIGNHCYCNEAVIASSVRVSHYCEVSRSFLGPNSTFSAFVITATLRADCKPLEVRHISGDRMLRAKIGCIIGSNTYIAPHVTISPNTTVGSNCFVGSFVFVNSDIPSGKRIYSDSSFVYGDNSLIVPRRNLNSFLNESSIYD
jgi:NDP-sugar pyrophosphorylase family protein